jgi:hypothetical protein
MSYFYVSYTDSNDDTKFATPYTTNPWNNNSTSTTVVVPGASGSTGPGTWTYFVIDSANTITSGCTGSTGIPPSNNVEVSSDSYLYTYISGMGGTVTSGGVGPGGGGFGAACLDMNYPVSGVLTGEIATFQGRNYTSETLGATGVYISAGFGATGELGDTGAPGASNSSLWFGSTAGLTGSNQSISSNIGFCIGGVGGQGSFGGVNMGPSYNTLPLGSPNWIGSTGSTGTSDSSNEYQIQMADGLWYAMPSANSGTNAANSSILFSVYNP